MGEEHINWGFIKEVTLERCVTPCQVLQLSLVHSDGPARRKQRKPDTAQCVQVDLIGVEFTNKA